MSVFALKDNMWWNIAKQLNDMGKMVFVARILIRTSWIKQIIAGQQFECQTCRTPNVCRIIIFRAQQHFNRSILSRLNVFREMMVLIKLKPHEIKLTHFRPHGNDFGGDCHTAYVVARIAQIGNFHTNVRVANELQQIWIAIKL